MKREGALIRFLLIACPVGLFLSAAIALAMIYRSHLEAPLDPNETIRLETAAFKRRPIDREILTRNIDLLANQIGERNLAHPDAQQKTALWLESTLGTGGIGYFVERDIFETKEGDRRNIIAELPGRRRRSEIVLVTAYYDSLSGSPGANCGGSGVAALIALARAYAGDPQERTVRFAFFANGATSQGSVDESGASAYAERCLRREENVVLVLSVENLGWYSAADSSQQTPAGLTPVFPQKGDFLAFLGSVGSEYAVDSAEAAFTHASSIPVQTRTLSDERISLGSIGLQAFSQWKLPVVSVTDTGLLRRNDGAEGGDIPDKIDLEKLEDATLGLEAILRAWANP